MTATATKPRPAPRPSTAGTMSLDEVTDQVNDLPDNFLVYGQPGAGKTSLAAQFPSPIFLMTDDGLLTLVRSGLVGKTKHFPKVAETAADVLAAVNELVVKDHPYQTLVVDTVSGVEALFAEQVCRDKYGNSREKFDAFGGNAGYKSVVPEWAKFLDSLSRLRDRQGVGTVLLAHAESKNFKNPEGADYGRFGPSLHKIITEQTVAWADAVLFYAFETIAVKDPAATMGNKHIGRGARRVLRCTRDAAYEAKNRLGLPDEIDCTRGPREAYKALAEAVAKARSRKAEGGVS